MPVELLLLVNGVPHSRFIANQFRADLASAGIGGGHRAFDYKLVLPLSPRVRNVVEVRRVRDGTPVHGSPWVLEPTGNADPLIGALLNISLVPIDAAPAVDVLEARRTLQGNIDYVSRRVLSGWVRDSKRDNEPLSLVASVDGEFVARVLANRMRPDLKASNLGNGRSGFEIPLPFLSPLVRHIIEVRREGDGVHIPGSPLSFEAESAFNAEFRSHAESLMLAAESDSATSERLSYLLGLVDRLQQQRAERRGATVYSRRRAWQEARQRPSARIAEIVDADETKAKAVIARPRALVVDYSMPVPGRDAGSNAVVSHMRALHRLGFAVSFIAADMSKRSESELDDAGIEVCGLPWYGSVEELLRREANTYELIYLHRYPIASRYLHLVRQYQPQARLVYSLADLHYLREKRQAELQQDSIMAASARRTQLVELLSISLADRVLTHSYFEAEQLRRQVPNARVHVVPWSVPARPTLVPFERRSGIAFIGGFAHAPNLDAAFWLIKEIVPSLRERDPSVECLLIGSDMPDALRGPMPGVVVMGQVEDLQEIFNRVRLTVAPLSFGAGIKGKVLESLAAGIPCVCTSIAAEGMNLPQALLQQVGDTTQDIVEAILRLHNDASLYQGAAAAGLEYVQAQLSEARIDALLGEAIGVTSLLLP